MAGYLKRYGHVCNCQIDNLEPVHKQREELRRAAGYLRKNKIRLQTSNMFGIPGETAEDALQTIRFNIELGTSFHADASAGDRNRKSCS
ncbi:MAG: hypothetical protein RAO92_09430 [Candidatus Euphemobacter frigidus]|nr:hypothetical protein [Candidatus Euphemobacter frigidus]MDP8276603.1 hypothetical protein [Candidatus Euphemobacter frigidus]